MLLQLLSMPLLSSYPFIAMLSGLSLAIVLSSASIAKNVLAVSKTRVQQLSYMLTNFINVQ